MNNIEIDIEIAEFADYLINKENEIDAAINYEFQPIPPIKIVDLEMNMTDEYNSYTKILLSNADEIEVELNEREKGEGDNGAPPYYEISFTINNQTPPGENIGLDFLESCGSGTYVDDIMNFYTKLKY